MRGLSPRAAARTQRLEQQLRANLQRRKQRSRVGEDTGDIEPAAPETGTERDQS